MKDILSEFLKEDAIKTEIPKQTLDLKEDQKVTPCLSSKKTADEDAIKDWWKQLRHFFRTGEKPKDAEIKRLYPVLLSAYFNDGNIITDFPFFLSEDENFQSQPLRNLLNNIFDQTFSTDEASILRANLPRLENYFRQFSNEEINDLKAVSSKAFDELRKLEVHGAEGEKFLKDIDTLVAHLSSSGQLIDFSTKVPILLLNNILNIDFQQHRNNFLNHIKKLSSGINDLLALEKVKTSKEIDEGFDFPGSMIEFSKIQKLMPQSASEQMPEPRFSRLQETLKVLNSANELLIRKNAVILIGVDLLHNENYNWESLFPNSLILPAPKGKSCQSSMQLFDDDINQLTILLAAVRVAELELKDQFNEEIHTEFFEHFDWHSFTDEEMSLCPPVILLNETKELLEQELSGFSHLLASNKPVKILALNHESSFDFSKNGQLKNDQYSFRQELAALAIAHRDTYTFQSTADNPLHLYDGIKSGLKTPSPVLLNVLVPAQNIHSHSKKSKVTQHIQNQDYLKLSAAVEGRYFPRFTYDQKKGMQWGSRFDISANPAPEKLWPQYEITILNENEEEVPQQFTFTFADYFAIEPYNQEKLLLIPEEYWTDDLIPIHQYLGANSDELYGKIPFIWMTDTENKLSKVAIPFSVVVTTQERLDFWNFIQELGGVNSFHVQKAIEQTRKVLEDEKNQEIAKLKEANQQELENVRANAAGEAMEKLSAFLLDMGDLETVSIPKPSTAQQPPDQVQETVEKIEEELQPGAEEVKVEEEEMLISSEPWVETNRCTSCNDCTDRFPHIFKYNEDKQAYLADASAGTYEELVQAAEGCPASCIHPGLPKNPDDPNMASWIKRAEPFN